MHPGSDPVDRSVKRRTFLQATGLTTAALVVGAGLRVGVFWWNQPAADSFEVLSEHEAQILEAIADALYPGDDGVHPLPNANQVGVVETFDGFLSVYDPLTRNFLRGVLHAIDDFSMGTGLSPRRFHSRRRASRQRILKSWENSRLGIRRGALTSLKLMIATAYTEDPRVLQAVGIEYSCGAFE